MNGFQHDHIIHEDAVVIPGTIVRHFKRELDPTGTNYLYRVIGTGVHTETGEELIVYRALYGEQKLWIRPLNEFLSAVDGRKYPDIKQVFRFEVLPDEEAAALKNGDGGEN